MSTPAHTPSSSGPDPAAPTLTRTAGDDPATTDLLRRHERPLPAVPGFRIVRWLGGGGMGDVYEAVDEKLNVTFALKMVRADRLSPGFAARFTREVRSMMGLDHPNVARIYAHNEVDGRPYFTMRFVRGGTLADRMPVLRADPREAVRVLVKVIDAVEYLHRQGQVHRDLKPTNVLVDEVDEPYLSDFGLVKDLDESTCADDPHSPDPVAAASTPPDGETLTAMPAGDRPNTRTGARLGTYGYMSPEQARGDVKRVGPASDVWALGVVLYEMLTGERPDREATPRTPGVDPEVDRIVLKCLSADPAERYASAALLAVDLRKWLEPAPIPVRRRRWPALAVAAVVLLAGVGITLAVLRPPRESTADDWRAWARTELRAGRAVTLVDKDGKPAPGFRFVAGAGPEKAEHTAGGWWSVSTTAAALAELLDDPGVDAFTLAGEFRPNLPGPFPRAGLYLASHRVPAEGQADWHYQIEYLYQEFPLNLGPIPAAPAPALPPPPRAKKYSPIKKELLGDPAGRREVRFHGSPFNGPGDNPDGGRSWPIVADRPEAGGPWRNLAIHARGESYAVSWDGAEEIPVADLTANQRDKLQNRGVIPWQGPPLRFTPRGGLGVIVWGGSAAVKNVTITPHPSP